MFKAGIAATLITVGWTNQILAQPLDIHASHAVIADFAQQIGGTDVVVTMPVPAGIDPAQWQPGIADIGAMQQSDLILLNGADYETWVDRVSLPRAKIVMTIRERDVEFIRLAGVAHSHGDGPAHTHEGIAPQVWLDFAAAAQQAQNIAAAITRMAPASAERAAANLISLETELMAIGQQAESLAALADGQTILVAQPGYEYFARAYGFDLVEATFDPSVPATAEQLATLDAIIADTQAHIMLWQTPVPDMTQAALQSRDISVVHFDNGANPAADISFTALMRRNLSNLRDALTPR